MQEAALLLAGRYEVGRLLGTGGMAKVYLARDTTLDRPVAVKVLAPPYDRDQTYVERFRREALAAASLNHPNIVTVFDTGEDGDAQFIVMELVEGETLGARLRRTGPMDADEVVTIGTAVAGALAEAHARGVVHRDVKPGNVMITADDRVKVLDFGIARASGAEAFTRTGLLMGSASYLSPEQAQGSSADERSDVYALGCVLYQMVTGRPPFVADDPVAALYQHVNEPVRPPSELRPVHPVLEMTIVRCLEKDPAARIPSAVALEAALADAGRAAGPSSDTDVISPFGAETVELDRPAIARAAEPHPERPPAGRPASGAPSSHRRRERRIALAILIAVAALALVAGLVAWADPFGGSDAEREGRQGGQRASTDPGGAAADAAAAIDDPAVAEPYAGLLMTIDAARRDGSLSPKGAGALRDRAADVVVMFEAGDTGALDDAIVAFDDELASRVGTGEADADTAVAIDGAFDDLVAAIAQALPATTGATGPTGTTGGRSDAGDERRDERDADEREGHDDDGGPPAHSNAGGNGEGNGNDD